MTDEASRPEHIDLAYLVAERRAGAAAGTAPRQADGHAARPEHLELVGCVRQGHDARDALTADRTDQAAIRDAKAAIRVLAEAFHHPAVQRLLATMEREPGESDSRQVLDPELQAPLAILLGQPADQPLNAGLVTGSIRDKLGQLASQAKGIANQPIPTDPAARAGHGALVQLMLDILISLLTNIMVAAAFTVKAVEDAARRGAIEAGDILVQTAHVVDNAAQGAGDVAGRALELAGPVLPWLLTTALVGVQAANAVVLIDHARQSIEPPRQPRPDTITPARTARQDPAPQRADAGSDEPRTAVGPPRWRDAPAAPQPPRPPLDDRPDRQETFDDFDPRAAIEPDAPQSVGDPGELEALVEQMEYQRGVAPDSLNTQRER